MSRWCFSKCTYKYERNIELKGANVILYSAQKTWSDIPVPPVLLSLSVPPAHDPGLITKRLAGAVSGGVHLILQDVRQDELAGSQSRFG
jgi:hypothetical protein